MKDNKTMNKPVIESKKVRKKFDRAFKEHAVELWLNSGRGGPGGAPGRGVYGQRRRAPGRGVGAPPPPGGGGGLWGRRGGGARGGGAAELGFHAQRLSAGRRRFAPPPPGGEGGGGAKRSAAQWEAENAGLRREKDYLQI